MKKLIVSLFLFALCSPVKGAVTVVSTNTNPTQYLISHATSSVQRSTLSVTLGRIDTLISNTVISSGTINFNNLTVSTLTVTSSGTITNLLQKGTGLDQSTTTHTGSHTFSTGTITSFTANSSTVSVETVSSTFTLLGSVLAKGLTAGTSGQMLLSQAGGLPPVWSAAGRLLQFKAASIITSSATTSTSFQNTSLTMSFTPTVANSTITLYMTGAMQNSVADQAFLTLSAGGTNLLGSSGGARLVAAASIETPVSLIASHFPGTTSAQTYTVQIKSSAGAAAQFCDTSLTCTLWAFEVGN